MIIENIMLHTVLSKRKVVLDQLRKGLETLDLLKEATKRPLLFESLFIATPDSITSERVKACLSFPNNLSEGQLHTKNHLLHYLDECPENGKCMMTPVL